MGWLMLVDSQPINATLATRLISLFYFYRKSICRLSTPWKDAGGERKALSTPRPISGALKYL